MGSYSHAIKIDVGKSDMIFVTGQIAMDKNGNCVAPNSIEEQTDYVFKEINKILISAGSSLDDIVKVVIYLTNINHFSKILPIRNKYLANAKPVSTLVEISNTVKEGCDIEIGVTAVKIKE
jgi:enamine deaminase RidA (YjgF/YER057c/UK114 family)